MNKNYKDLHWTKLINDKFEIVYISDIEDYLKDNNIIPQRIPINMIEHLCIVSQDSSERVENADLSYPIIVVRLNGNIIRVIDGNHRLRKAMNLSHGDIRGYVIDLEKTNDIWIEMFK